jgi:hypothetical protein
MFLKLRTALSAEQLAEGKDKAPTHPPPPVRASSGPGTRLAGPAAGVVDRVRDKLSDHPSDPNV